MKNRFAAALLATLLSCLGLAGCGGADDSADVVVSGAGPTEPVAPGAVATFVMTVTNEGPDFAADILVQNTVDDDLTLQGIACVASGGATCPSIDINGNKAGFTIGALPAQASLSFTVSALVPAGVTGSVQNSMFTREPPWDPDPSNNSLTVSAVVATAQLAVTYDAPEFADGGQDVAFVANVSNFGPGAAADVEMTRTVPAGTTAGPVICEAFDGAVCPADLTSDPLIAPSMPVDSRLRLQMPVHTPPTLRGAITSSFTATTPSDPNLDNNTAAATTTLVAPTANLAVAHNGPQNPVVAGTSLVLRAQVSNLSGDSSFGVHLVESLPAGYTPSGTPTCEATGGATCPAALGLVMDLPVLPALGSLTFQYIVPVPLSAAGSEITAVFSATADGDPSSEDNTRSATTQVRAPVADIQVVHKAPVQVDAGGPLQLTAFVTNLGPDTGHSVALTYTLAGAATAPVFTCTAFGGATCPAAPSSAMTLPELPAGGSLQITVATTGGAAGSSVTGTMLATTGDDANAGNDSDTDTVAVVVPPVNLSSLVSIAATSGLDSDAFFTATVFNGGPNAATNLTLDFTLDPNSFGVTGVSCQASANAACPATLGATTTVPTLAAGTWLQLSYQVPVPAGAALGTLLTGTFSAAADGDPASGDNVASAVTTIVAATADIAVSQSVDETTPAGDQAEFVVLIANLGPRTASNVAVIQTFSPAATATVSCTPLRGAVCPTIADPAAFTIASLPVDGALRLVYRVPTTDLVVGDTLQATIRAAYDGDPMPDDDEATATTTIAP